MSNNIKNYSVSNEEKGIKLERESKERCCHKRKQGREQRGGLDGNWGQGHTV